jgi:hypothetical protein
MLASDRSRYAWRICELRGTGPVLAGNVGTGWAFALAREGE